MSSPAPSPPPPPPSSTTNATSPPLPLPPQPGGITTAVLVVLIVGIVVGVALVLFCLGGYWIYRRKKKRRRESILLSQGGKGDLAAIPLQHWQQNAPPPPLRNAFNMLPKPLNPPRVATPSADGKFGCSMPLQSPSPGIASFTYEELETATDGFSIANLLGQGGFGYVHKGVLTNGEVVAIKQLKAESKQGEREFQAEVGIISRIHHRNLVTLLGYSMTEDQRMLVYEYVPNKTLEFHLHGKEGSPVMSWATRMKIALGSARGLAYLHEGCQPKIIHRDIKAANILLDNNFEAKVADFGLARFCSDAETHVSTRVMGTFGYLAPEYASSGWLNDRSDVYSFGVVLLELITGHRPVHRIEDDSMIDWVKPLLTRALEDGNFDAFADPRLQKGYNSSEMARMVASAAACVRHSARRRPRMGQIVRALEGNISLDDLSEGLRPGDSAIYCSSGSSDSESQHYEDINSQKMALETKEQDSSEGSLLNSDCNNHLSRCRSDSQNTTQEIEIEILKKHKLNNSKGR